MPVQLINLEEVSLLEISDEAIEIAGEKSLKGGLSSAMFSCYASCPVMMNFS